MRLSLLLVVATCLSLFACRPTQRPDGGRGPLPVGARVPALATPDHRGEVVDLRKPAGATLIYFYPRDGTPGCTKEACALRDVWERFERARVRVVGVSSDSNESHREFAKEHQLPFSLIADPDHVWSKAFGVGSLGGFDKRMSFLIDAQGKVAKVYPEVDPGVHATQVLADAQGLGLTAK